ncbi:hypothetical protein [Streptomyces sp. KMM 9044]|uniref:hypothetical protein n=1 Tax=Streptomyces sp. KMM 9044 TaxID=2744474 RepID=UPI002150D79A|nr:hypothetical protein [Streptomyces sp. KMM 9044]WAX78231.1 hypothetical protein HUV60_011655 [Streptomyces sp. KMM 9044]
MEQRIGSNSQPQPLEGAGFDPAFIPGLTAPASGRKADVKDVKGEEEPKDAKAAPEAETDAAGEPGTQSGAAASLEKPAASGAAEASEAAGVSSVSETSGSSEAESVTDGPVFEASDRRAGIVADHEGVRLRLDDQACEFRWDEIGAVETETGRFGKRYTVTVHTTESRWYPIEIEATSRSRFPVWDAELDAVLDAYFDDGAPEPEASDADSSDKPEPDADADADADTSRPDAGPVV